MNKYIPKKEANNLKRDIYPLPSFIEEALKKNGLVNQYKSRPAYQKNDYIGWITRAKTQKTKNKRLNQMLDELRKGNKYMKMDWKP